MHDKAQHGRIAKVKALQLLTSGAEKADAILQLSDEALWGSAGLGAYWASHSCHTDLKNSVTHTHKHTHTHTHTHTQEYTQ